MIEISVSDIPAVSEEQMLQVDQIAVRDYQINLIQMMENAGFNFASLARDVLLNGAVQDKRILVLAGSGGNGGGAMVAARRLSNWGGDVTLGLSGRPASLAPTTAHQLAIVEVLPIKLAELTTMGLQPLQQKFDLVLDGLIGYSLNGEPRGQIQEIIQWVNGSALPVLSLDLPSGVDATRGAIHSDAIKAEATLTLALPKIGLLADNARENVGDLYLADLGLPPTLYQDLTPSIQVGSIFEQNEIVYLRR